MDWILMKWILAWDKLFTAVHPDDVEKVRQVYFPSRHCQEGGLELEHRIIKRKSAEVRYLQERFAHVADENGDYSHTIGTVSDITETYLANQVLLEKQDELNALLEIVADGIISINADGSIRAFNAKAENLFGYKPEQIIGHNVSELMPPSYSKHHDGYLQRYLTTGEKKIIGSG